MSRGKFITFEGIDGAGKSTHLEWVADFLRDRGVTVVVTREPGGTELGEKLRRLLLEGAPKLHPETEALLMFAARREHLDKLIVPALSEGSWVLCDRFSDATYAYQAGGSRIPWDKIKVLENWVQTGLQPDVTVYLDLAPDVGRGRVSQVRHPDRFEREEADFHKRVRQAYLRRVREDPHRIHVIDASAALAKVKEQLKELFSTICKY